MPAGWKGKLLDVDLTSGRITQRDALPLLRRCLGGRALAAELAWAEIPPDIHPYDAANRVIIATGPLTGTLAPTSGRTFMSSLSPRVYPRPWYTHSTLGGWFGPMLKYAGFDAVIIHGCSPRPVYLDVREGKASLQDAAALWGLDSRDTQLRLKERHGAETQVLAIGQAGENRVRFATVQHAEENAAGHSGFGAVWGSKNLKAVTAYGTAGVQVADSEGLLGEVRGIGKFKITPLHSHLHNNVERGAKRKPICSQSCTFNCFVGNQEISADGQIVTGQCIGGLVWLSDKNMEGTRYSGGGVEVPAGVNFARHKEIGMHVRCNALGIDQWFRLVFQPWLMALEQRGIHAIRGFPIAPSDPAWFDDLMTAIAFRQGLGDLFAEDLRRVVDELEDELPADLIALGRSLEFAFGFPSHREGRFWDEEPLPYWVISAMMYASESRDPTIGTHQSSLLIADLALANPELTARHMAIISQKVYGCPDAFEPTFDNKAPVAIWSQHQHILIDSLTLCDFAFPQLIRPIETEQEWQAAEDISGDLDVDLRMLNAVTGQAYTRADLEYIAERAFTIERLMLARAGRGRPMEEALAPHFRLPCRADGTSIDAAGFSRLLDEYYSARGWDLVNGWPTPTTLERLGL